MDRRNKSGYKGSVSPCFTNVLGIRLFPKLLHSKEPTLHYEPTLKPVQSTLQARWSKIIAE